MLALQAHLVKPWERERQRRQVPEDGGTLLCICGRIDSQAVIRGAAIGRWGFLMAS